jgi:hypothetical protein
LRQATSGQFQIDASFSKAEFEKSTRKPLSIDWSGKFSIRTEPIARKSSPKSKLEPSKDIPEGTLAGFCEAVGPEAEEIVEGLAVLITKAEAKEQGKTCD